MRRALVVTGLVLLFLVPSASLAAVPSPVTSVVPHLVGCPAGDLSFTVIVRDIASNPVTGSTVILSLASCPSFTHCSGTFAGYAWDSTARIALAITDSAGGAHFAIHQGGVCSSVQVTADGVPLANRAFASTDQNGDMTVDSTDVVIVLGKLGTSDRTADFDGNSVVDTADVATVQNHRDHNCGGIPPVVANAGPDITEKCAGPSGAFVQLDGSGSQGLSLTFTWSAPGITFNNPHGVAPRAFFPQGTTEVTLEVQSDQATDVDQVLVTVLGDVDPPVAQVSLSPSLLWPPNNRLVPVHATVSAFDSCGSDSLQVTLFSITEIDGDSTLVPIGDDVQGAALGTADFDFALRAERTQGNARRYIICYQVRDSAGNAADVCANVTVARDNNGQAQLLSSPGGGWKLTLFGSEEHDASTANGSSIVVRAGDEDVFLGSGEAPSLVDMNGDSFVDAVFKVTPTGSGSIGGQTLWARWSASSGFYLAEVEATPVSVGPDEMSFGVRVSPNPATARASMVYAVPARGHARLRVFDVHGRAVATLVDGVVTAGRHNVSFDAAHKTGASLYFYTLEANGRRASGKFVMVK